METTDNCRFVALVDMLTEYKPWAKDTRVRFIGSAYKWVRSDRNTYTLFVREGLFWKKIYQARIWRWVCRPDEDTFDLKDLDKIVRAQLVIEATLQAEKEAKELARRDKIAMLRDIRDRVDGTMLALRDLTRSGF